MRLRAALFVLLALVAGGLLAARNYNTSGTWVCTGSCTIPDGGSAASVTSLAYGSSSVTSHTFTGSDTGDATFAPPENGLGADDLAAAIDHVVLCGQMDENGTIYFGPNTAAFGGDGSDTSLASGACDALDDATEATADAPIFTDLAFKVMGGWCKLNGTLGASETATFTVRTAAADAVTTDGSNTALTCSLATGEVECSIPYGTTTDVAAGATIAIKAVQVSNNADDDGWCKLAIAVK